MVIKESGQIKVNSFLLEFLFRVVDDRYTKKNKLCIEYNTSINEELQVQLMRKS